MAGDEQVQKSDEHVEQKIDASQLTDEQKEEAKRGYTQWAKEKGYDLYESWIPWIEDQYLSWFTKSNKASYATKQQLDKTKVTNIEGVNKLQDDLNSLASNQLGKGGLLQPIGDAVSKEGINRAERSGKDNKSNYLPDSMSSVEGAGKTAASGVTEGAKTSGGYLSSAGGYASSAGSSAYSGAKGAAGYVGGMFGGKKDATAATDNETEVKEKTQKAAPAKQQQTRPMVDQAENESTVSQTGAQQAPKADTSAAQQVTQPVTNAASKGAGTAQDGAKAGGGYLASAGGAAKGAGGYVTGMFGKKS